MANVSNWKGSEAKAAKLFPGGKRRLRVGGTYALLADDVVWGPEILVSSDNPPRVIKTFRNPSGPPVYIDVKKKGSSALVTEFDAVEKKYKTAQEDRLVLITHKKGQKRQLVTMSDEFFHELLIAWCRERGIPVEE